MARDIDSSRFESSAEGTQRGGFGNFDLLSEMQAFQSARRPGADSRTSQDDSAGNALQIAQASDKNSAIPVLRPQPPVTRPGGYTINGDGTVTLGRGPSIRVDTWTINK